MKRVLFVYFVLRLIEFYNLTKKEALTVGDFRAILLIIAAIAVIVAIVRSIRKADEKERSHMEAEAIRRKIAKEKAAEKASRQKQAALDNWHQSAEQGQAMADAGLRREKQENTNLTFPAEVNGIPAAYHYKKVLFTASVDGPLEPMLGSPVSFQFSDGVAYVVLNGAVIGALNPCRICEMVDSWIRRDEPFLSYFTCADDEKREYGVDIAFYWDKFKYLIRKHPDAKKYKLTGNRSEEMQGNIGDLKTGQRLTLEYDYDKEKYAVLDGWEIGYLPASAAKIVDEYGPDDVDVFVAGTEIDDDFKTIVYVYVFD